MSQLKFKIKIDDSKPASDENLIHVDVDVPLGDVPYFLEMSYDEKSDRLIAKFQYQTPEKQISTLENEKFEIKYGALTGRMYEMQLKGFKEIVREQYNTAKMAKILKTMNSLKKTNSNIRFKSNVDLSKNILRSSFQRAKDYNFDHLVPA